MILYPYVLHVTVTIILPSASCEILFADAHQENCKRRYWYSLGNVETASDDLSRCSEKVLRYATDNIETFNDAVTMDS